MTVSELYSYYTELTVHFTSLNRLFYEVMQHSSEFGDWYPPVLKKSIEILSEASSLQKMVVSEMNKYEEELLQNIGELKKANAKLEAEAQILRRRKFYSELLEKADDAGESEAKDIIVQFFAELLKDRNSGYDNVVLSFDKEIQKPFGKHEILFTNYLFELEQFKAHFEKGEYKEAAQELWELNNAEPCFLRGTREGLIEAGKILLGVDFPA